MIAKIGSAIWEKLSRFILRCVNLILRPFGKKLDEKQSEAFLQFCKFALVGVSNTLLAWLIIVVVLWLLSSADLLQEHHIDVYVANVVSFILSVLWSFFWNSRFVFKADPEKEKRVWWKVLLKTYAAYAVTGIGLNNILSFVTVSCLGINKYIAPIINLLVAVPVNFILNKFWAYRGKKSGPKDGTIEKDESLKEQQNMHKEDT